MSDQELIKIDPAQVQKYSDDDFNKVVESGGYLPRLQLLTSNSQKCKNGEFPINHFALVKDKNYTDLGQELDILIIAWRPKALMIDEEIISNYDHESDQFKVIAEKSEEKDSGCLYGPEYLIWIPEKETFALFFMGSKSARRESGSMNSRLLKSGTLKPKKCETKRYTWYTTTVTDCSTSFDVPSSEDISEQLEKFNNPPESETEIVDDDKEEESPAEQRAR